MMKGHEEKSLPVDLKCTTEILDESRQRSVLRIAFDGTYPPGSEGNAAAELMRREVVEAVARYRPAAVLLDLRGLVYTWGDTIGGIAFALAGSNRTFPLSIPTGVLALGRTAEALKPLFGSTFIFGIAGAQLFESVDAAIDYLKGRLVDETA